MTRTEPESSRIADTRAVITTEKDSVRFPRLGKRPLPVYFLRVEIEIIRGHDAFNRCLEQMCRYNSPADVRITEDFAAPAVIPIKPPFASV